MNVPHSEPRDDGEPSVDAVSASCSSTTDSAPPRPLDPLSRVSRQFRTISIVEKPRTFSLSDSGSSLGTPPPTPLNNSGNALASPTSVDGDDVGLDAPDGDLSIVQGVRVDVDEEANNRRAKLVADLNADSSQALGLFEEFFKVEVMGLPSASQQYSLPVSYTVEDVKKYLFGKEPLLSDRDPSNHNLGVLEGAHLTISFAKFVRSHESLLKAWQDGHVLHVYVYASSDLAYDGPKYRDRSDTLRFLANERKVSTRSSGLSRIVAAQGATMANDGGGGGGAQIGARGSRRGRGRARGAPRASRGRGGRGAMIHPRRRVVVPPLAPSHRQRAAHGLVSPRDRHSPGENGTVGRRSMLHSSSLQRPQSSRAPSHRSRKAMGLRGPSPDSPTSLIKKTRSGAVTELPPLMQASLSMPIINDGNEERVSGEKETFDDGPLPAHGTNLPPSSSTAKPVGSPADAVVDGPFSSSERTPRDDMEEPPTSSHGICDVTGYTIEEPSESICAGSLEEMALQDTERYVTYYNDYFYSKEHAIFMGMHPKYGAMIVFILLDAVSDVESLKSFFFKIQQSKSDPKGIIRSLYRALVWCKNGEESIFIQYGGKEIKNQKKRADALMKKLKEQCELVTGASFKLIDEPSLPRKLLELEIKQVVVNYKVGVVYARQGQVEEEDMFSNETGSDVFTTFLGVLGDTITLKGWSKYRGGLNVVDDATGKHAVFATHRTFGIIYHVSTMLPFSATNRQQLHRKRHIGNDIVVIVFIEGDTPFNPKKMVSEFNHVFFVVRPVYDENKVLHFSLSVVYKDGVQPFLPRLPAEVYFLPGPAFREFILTKLINAERGAYYAPNFAKKIRRTKKMLLDDLYADFGKK